MKPDDPRWPPERITDRRLPIFFIVSGAVATAGVIAWTAVKRAHARGYAAGVERRLNRREPLRLVKPGDRP